jgi:hypothetical protein
MDLNTQASSKSSTVTSTVRSATRRPTAMRTVLLSVDGSPNTSQTSFATNLHPWKVVAARPGPRGTLSGSPVAARRPFRIDAGDSSRRGLSSASCRAVSCLLPGSKSSGQASLLGCWRPTRAPTHRYTARRRASYDTQPALTAVASGGYPSQHSWSDDKAHERHQRVPRRHTAERSG